MKWFLAALVLTSCAEVNPFPSITKHLDPVCTYEPYHPIDFEVVPAEELDAGPDVVDTGIWFPTEIDHTSVPENN